MRKIKFFTVLLFLFALCSCNKTESEKGKEPVLPEEGAPIEVVDGKVTFFVRAPYSMNGRIIKVNSQSYTVSKDGSGREYVIVNVSSFGDYACEYLPVTASPWHSGEVASKNLFLPHGQFVSATETDLKDMPLFALYRAESGNVLNFHGPYATIRLSCTGEGKIASICAQCTEGVLAGQYDFDPYTDSASPVAALDCAVLNCMKGGGAPMRGEYDIAVLPGAYKGLELNVVSTDHRSCVVKIGNVNLAAGEVRPCSLAWAPGDNLFFEGFDTFVWGGDIMGGNQAAAFSPDASKPEAASPIARTGYEYAVTKLSSCTTAGASYFSQYTNGIVTRIMGDDYWQSRNMSDYEAVVRVQEYQGCIAVGTVNNHRGWVKTPALHIPRLTDVKFEFDICPGANAIDDICIQFKNAGILTSLKIGNTEYVNSLSNRRSPDYEANLSRSSFTLPASDISPKQWNHVTAIVGNASDNTSFEIISSTSENGYHTFYLDNLRVTALPSTQVDSYRMIYWNILCGMATDSDNNYSNFVNWLNFYNPDLCVWCEARSHSRENYYLPANYPALAARYNHGNCVGTGTYHMTGVSGAGTEGFPQEVTSKYPLRKIKDITYSAKIKNADGTTSTRISHGGGIVEVDLGGRRIYVVALHLIPRTTADFDAADEYQENEIRTILEASILNKDYAAQKDWIMCGDFNSQSPGDQWYYGSNKKAYRAHRYIKDHTDMIDVVQKKYEGIFMASTYSAGRIDYIYASPSVYKDIVRAGTLLDSFSTSYHITDSPRSYAEYYPSDHRPLMIEIKK